MNVEQKNLGFSPQEEASLMMKFDDQEAAAVRLAVGSLYLKPSVVRNLLDDYEIGVQLVPIAEKFSQADQVTREAASDCINEISGEFNAEPDLLKDLLAGYAIKPKEVGALFSEVDEIVKSEISETTRSGQLDRLHEEMTAYEPQFKNREMVGVLYGSYNYGAAGEGSDLDFDFVVTDDNQVHPQLRDLSDELGDWLDISMHTRAIMPKEIMSKLKDISNGIFFKGGIVDKVIMNSETQMNVGAILFGTIIDLPGANSDKIIEQITGARKEIKKLAQANVHVRAMVCSCLIYIIEKSKSRQS